MRVNLATDVAFMGKIYKQAVTRFYWKEYQSFRRILVKFRENLACF